MNFIGSNLLMKTQLQNHFHLWWKINISLYHFIWNKMSRLEFGHIILNQKWSTFSTSLKKYWKEVLNMFKISVLRIRIWYRYIYTNFSLKYLIVRSLVYSIIMTCKYFFSVHKFSSSFQLSKPKGSFPHLTTQVIISTLNNNL